MYIAYLLLGSNLGDSEKYIADALELIGLKVGKIYLRSSLYRTASWGKHDQPDFINQVISLQTEQSAADVLESILSIEKELGRERNDKWGSRTIDIDLLLFGNRIINTPSLSVPHPLMHERRFALEPLCEIAPDLIHPIFHKSIGNMLKDLPDRLFVKKLS